MLLVPTDLFSVRRPLQRLVLFNLFIQPNTATRSSIATGIAQRIRPLLEMRSARAGSGICGSAAVVEQG